MTVAMTLTGFTNADENRVLDCTFTDTSYKLQVNLNSGKIVKTTPTWNSERQDYEFVKTILSEVSDVVFNSGQQSPSLMLVDYQGKKLFSGNFNFEGNDGRSDYISIVDASHYSEDAFNGVEYGACTFGGIESYLEYRMTDDESAFAKNANQAISLCFNRAVSNWAIATSEYDQDVSVFYSLYSKYTVPGEPGNVSWDFLNGEAELLGEVLTDTQRSVEDGASYYAVEGAAWDYCTLYAELLQTRYLH